MKPRRSSGDHLTKCVTFYWSSEEPNNKSFINPVFLCANRPVGMVPVLIDCKTIWFREEEDRKLTSNLIRIFSVNYAVLLLRWRGFAICRILTICSGRAIRLPFKNNFQEEKREKCQHSSIICELHDLRFDAGYLFAINRRVLTFPRYSSTRLTDWLAGWLVCHIRRQPDRHSVVKVFPKCVLYFRVNCS